MSETFKGSCMQTLKLHTAFIWDYASQSNASAELLNSFLIPPYVLYDPNTCISACVLIISKSTMVWKQQFILSPACKLTII
jgi:hypothetical protein